MKNGQTTLYIVIALAVCILLGNVILKNSKKESPAILKAEYDASVNVYYLTLREDGTYRLNDMYLGSVWKGNYLIKEDSIILDKNISIGAVSMSKTWHLQGDSILFYTFFPDENIVFEDNLCFIIKMMNINLTFYIQ